MKVIEDPQGRGAWTFSEALGRPLDEEKKILIELQTEKDVFDRPKSFVMSVLEDLKDVKDQEEKLLILANVGKIIGFFS